MKQGVNPVVAVVIIIIVLVVVAAVVWKSTAKKTELKTPEVPDLTAPAGAGAAAEGGSSYQKGDPNNPAPPLMEQMKGSKGGG